MGTHKNIQPAQLPAKLRAVRRYIGLTQEELIKYIVPETDDARAIRSKLSEFESGVRSPSLQQTLNYAKAVIALTSYKNFLVEHLIDDNLALPFADSGTDHTANKSDRGRESNSVTSVTDGAIRELQNVDCPEDAAAAEQSASLLAENADCLPDSADLHFKLFDQLCPVADSESAAESDRGDTLKNVNTAQPKQPSDPEPSRRKYPRIHNFSREQLINFDDFRLRLLLLVEHERRSEWGDSSAALEIAIAAALLDLENYQHGITTESLILTLLQTDFDRDN